MNLATGFRSVGEAWPRLSYVSASALPVNRPSSNMVFETRLSSRAPVHKASTLCSCIVVWRPGCPGTMHHALNFKTLSDAKGSFGHAAPHLRSEDTEERSSIHKHEKTSHIGKLLAEPCQATIGCMKSLLPYAAEHCLSSSTCKRSSTSMPKHLQNRMRLGRMDACRAKEYQHLRHADGRVRS